MAKKKEPLLSKEDWKIIGLMFLTGLVFGFLGSSFVIVVTRLLR